ncbi:MAG: glycoside hydrolase family 9 protein [Cytophagaceae bacterium]|nr:glycoside hydrolase family 9 protein [Cytophagaceae bacterium]MDW8457235.1 glycoside hydrolase family 9 protein [Cytophagaceae bacterium]
MPGKILINQVGYELNCPKIAVYQTNITSLPTDSFYVLNMSNQIVHRGLGVYRGNVTGWTNRYYWTLNFTNFNTPGTYKLKMKAGDLYSYNFSINQNLLFNNLAPLVVTFFNGMRHTGTSDNNLSFYGPRNDFVNVYGGWWDATGDPGKHMSHLSYANYFNPQQIPMVVWSLLKSYSLNPPAYSSFSAPLLAEAAWGADYLCRNTDPAGYLYLAIFDDWGNAPATREICEWGQAPACDNCRTANYQAAMREGAGMAIAALARASYMNITGGSFTPAQYLSRAQLLYNHLKSPGTGYATKNLEYCNDHVENIIDFYCGLLAATELYKATSNPVYLSDAQNYANLLMARQHTDGYLYSNTASTRPFYHAADEGLPVLALVEFATIDASYNSAINTFLTKWINWYHTITTEITNPFMYMREYGCPYSGGTLQPARKAFFLPHSNETGYWWQGENARLASMAAAMMAAYRFNGAFNFDGGLYSQIVISQLDWILGKNPFDVCMMTGVGTTTYPAYLNGAKKTNITGGICNGITSRDSGGETDIEWAPYDQASGDAWRNWRWIEQWLPHDAWFLLALAYVNHIIANPLPLTLINFSLETQQNTVYGYFSTTDEKNISHYIIQKSYDGKDFNSFVHIPAQNSEYFNLYEFEDITSEQDFEMYYRIVSVNSEGKLHYFPAKNIRKVSSLSVQVFPNPFFNEIFIHPTESGTHSVSVINSQGSIIFETTTSSHSAITIPTESWSKGLYTVKVSNTSAARVFKMAKY